MPTVYNRKMSGHQSMRPLILVTNDDGVDSAGLRAAAEAAAALGEVLIVAPKTKQTAMVRSFPQTAGQGIIETLLRPQDAGTNTYYLGPRFPCPSRGTRGTRDFLASPRALHQRN